MITVMVVWHADQGLSLMLLMFLARAILVEMNDTRLSGRKYPSEYFMVLLTLTKAFC